MNGSNIQFTVKNISLMNNSKFQVFLAVNQSVILHHDHVEKLDDIDYKVAF